MVFSSPPFWVCHPNVFAFPFNPELVPKVASGSHSSTLLAFFLLWCGWSPIGTVHGRPPLGIRCICHVVLFFPERPFLLISPSPGATHCLCCCFDTHTTRPPPPPPPGEKEHAMENQLVSFHRFHFFAHKGTFLVVSLCYVDHVVARVPPPLVFFSHSLSWSPTLRKSPSTPDGAIACSPPPNSPHSKHTFLAFFPPYPSSVSVQGVFFFLQITLVPFPAGVATRGISTTTCPPFPFSCPIEKCPHPTPPLFSLPLLFSLSLSPFLFWSRHLPPSPRIFFVDLIPRLFPFFPNRV